MFHLIKNSELEVTFDVVGVDDHLPSVAFNIDISWNMPYQKVRMEIFDCWIECSDFDSFYDGIRKLIKQESGEVTLSDLSNNPVLTFKKFDNELTSLFYAQDTCKLGQSSLKVNGYTSELPKVAYSLGEFEKWW